MGCDRSSSETGLRADDPVAMRQAMQAIESSLASARIDDALRIASRLTEVAPESASAQELLGRALIARANETRDPLEAAAVRTSAADAYARAVALAAPASAGLLNAAGVTAQAAQRVDEAIALFLEAELEDPSNAQHPLFAGLALHQAGRVPEARAALERAARVDPASPWPVAGLSAIALASGDPEEALKLARKARAKAPRQDALRVAEAKALRKLARHRETLTLLLALPTESQLTEAVAWEIAAAYGALGEPIEAARFWGKFAESVSTSESALEAARLWLEAGDPVQAGSWQRVAASRS